MADPTDPRITTTRGPAPEGTPPGPAVGPVGADGMHDAYFVLSQAERDKDFVRPLRLSYVHRGVRPRGPTRDLMPEESERYLGQNYVAFEPYPDDDGIAGRFWTAEQLRSGCGACTTMGIAIAETYAREPKFYGSTFCAGCKKHLPVAEFVWAGTDEVVGS